MNVQTLSYLLFLLVIWLIAWPIRRPGARNAVLLAASLGFYATWGLGFLGVLLASTLINFVWGGVMRKRPTLGNLWVAIGINALILAVFKYLPAALISSGSHDWFITHILMPVGVSFWTFQALSYHFDLYREEDIDPTPVEFALYMSFWPTVLSGPVCRMPSMLPQFRAAQRPGWEDVAEGTRRIVIGLFMKLCLARLIGSGLTAGEGIDMGFDQMAKGWGGIDVVFLAIAFGFQLFFDFAGYTHIVIGTARLFGLELQENFDRPFFALTPSAFWTRWHMSLSFWIRDYIFIPLATMRPAMWWRIGLLGSTMVFFGFWHAATWPFILWGVYHGILLVLHRVAQLGMRRFNLEWPALLNPLAWALTFGLMALGWIFFRAHSAGQAFTMLSALAHPRGYTHMSLRPNCYIVTAMVIGGYFLWEALRWALQKLEDRAPTVAKVRWLLSPPYYAALILVIIIWSTEESLFVYFQF